MINDHTSMDALAPAECAKKAIAHVLVRVRDDSRVGYYLGHGTESFALLTEALARLEDGEPLTIREEFSPRDPKDPCEELRDEINDLNEALGNATEDASNAKSDPGPVFGPSARTRDQVIESVLMLLADHAHDPRKCVREIAALFDATDLPISLLIAS